MHPDQDPDMLVDLRGYKRGDQTRIGKMKLESNFWVIVGMSIVAVLICSLQNKSKQLGPH